MIFVIEADFSVSKVYDDMTKSNRTSGAVVMFIGRVREHNQGHNVDDIIIEHYPKMTDKALLAIEHEANNQWHVDDITIIHRVGKLTIGDQIVLVSVTSAHRQQAFEAAMYIMDELKIRAPFWKKEKIENGEFRWVKSQISLE